MVFGQALAPNTLTGPSEGTDPTERLQPRFTTKLLLWNVATTRRKTAPHILPPGTHNPIDNHRHATRIFTGVSVLR